LETKTKTVRVKVRGVSPEERKELTVGKMG